MKNKIGIYHLSIYLFYSMAINTGIYKQLLLNAL